MAGDSERPLSLDELRERYIRLGLEISHGKKEHRQFDYEVRKLLNKRRDLTERAQGIDYYNGLIGDMKKGRGDIGLLAVGERLEHEEKLMRINKRKAEAVRQLHEDYKIKPEEIPKAWQEVDREYAELEKKRGDLPNVDRLIGEQHEVGQEYKILSRREGAEPEEKPAKELTLTDRLAIIQAENDLKKLSEPDREKEPEKEHDRERR